MAGRMAVLMAAVMAAVTVVMWDMRTVGWKADLMVDRMALTSDGSAAAVTADPTEQRTAVPMAASKAVELAVQMDGPMGFPLVHHWVASSVGWWVVQRVTHSVVVLVVLSVYVWEFHWVVPKDVWWVWWWVDWLG